MRSRSPEYNHSSLKSLCSSVGRALAADLAALGLRPAEGINLFYHKQGSAAHRISLSPIHCPDMTETVLTRAPQVEQYTPVHQFWENI